MAAADDGTHGTAQERRVPLGHGQPQHLALHRPHGRQDLVRDAREPSAQAAGGQDHLPGGEVVAVGGPDACGTVAHHRQPFGPRPVEDDPGPLAGDDQGRGQPARVDLVVSVDPQTAAHTGREHRLQATALASVQPLRREARPLLKRVQFPQVGTVVGVQRHRQRAAPAVAEVPAGRLGELVGEVGVATGGLEVQAEQRLLPVVQFGDGREHPGGHLAAPPPGSGSTTAVESPCRAARQAVTSPMIPPPTTRTSDVGVGDMGVEPLPSPA